MDDQEVLKRYLAEEMVEEYQEGRLSRRTMIKTVGQILGVAIVGPALLNALGDTAQAHGSESEVDTPDIAPVPSGQTQGVTVPENDPAITVRSIELAGNAGPIKGYLARPKGKGRFPTVVLIHENRGLTEHNRDVARRFAKTGYVALAVDLLSRLGGTEKFPTTPEATAAIGTLLPNDVIADLRSSVAWLRTRSYVRKGQLAAIGWCWGGGMAWRLATAEPRLEAVAAFYGPNPPLEAVPNIRAAVLGIYGGDDARITGGIGVLEKALKDADITYELKVYAGAKHAFFNDTGANFHPTAAWEAWRKTLEWFEEYL
jgi:carboxymethylenebutenolidase